MKFNNHIVTTDIAKMLLNAFSDETIRIAARNISANKYDNYLRLLDIGRAGIENMESDINGIYPYMEDNDQQFILVYGGTSKYHKDIVTKIEDTYFCKMVVYIFLDNIKNVNLFNLDILSPLINKNPAPLFAILIACPNIMDSIVNKRSIIVDAYGQNEEEMKAYDWFIKFFYDSYGDYNLDQIAALGAYSKEVSKNYTKFLAFLQRIRCSYRYAKT